MMEEGVKAGLQGLVKRAIFWDCPLRDYTSFAIGGPAAALALVDTVSELQAVLLFLRAARIPWRVIGKGTNLLVSDAGYDGVILLLDKGFAGIARQCETQADDSVVILRVGAACSLARLVGWCTEHSLTGLEFAVGIPGTVGGAVVMNAGAWGSELAAVLHSLSFIDAGGRIQTRLRSELHFGYRIWHDYQQAHKGGEEEWALFEVELKCGRGEQEQIRARCQQYHQQRQAKQPREGGNAGSFFKNPAGEAAGRLIEASGLKGAQVGGARVSPVHANFIVNCGGATAAQVLELMARIQGKVLAESGVSLEPEVHFLGG
jgi:UDP-N-acetylmuramate dehydrogenase